LSSRIKKANTVFVQLYPLWRNLNISKEVKLRIFYTNVKSVLLYASKSWKTTNHITRRLQIFVNKCLRRIMNIKWTDTITNEELWRITHQKATDNQIKRWKWNWIGHTLRKETGAIEKTILDWNPQGYRRRGRPKRTWRRTIEDEIRSTRRSWKEVKGIAGDRNAWKHFMNALCSTRNKRIWWWWSEFVGYTPNLCHVNFLVQYVQETLFRETDFGATVDLNAALFLTSQNVRSHLATGKYYTVDSRKFDKITST